MAMETDVKTAVAGSVPRHCLSGAMVMVMLMLMEKAMEAAAKMAMEVAVAVEVEVEPKMEWTLRNLHHQHHHHHHHRHRLHHLLLCQHLEVAPSPVLFVRGRPCCLHGKMLGQAGALPAAWCRRVGQKLRTLCARLRSEATAGRRAVASLLSSPPGVARTHDSNRVSCNESHSRIATPIRIVYK